MVRNSVTTGASTSSGTPCHPPGGLRWAPCGSDDPTPADLDRYADEGVRVFLAAYGAR